MGATIFFILVVILAILTKRYEATLTGALGEWRVKQILSKLDPNTYMVINDALLPKGSETSQIDHIVVSTFGIFVIETKNWSGWIFGDEKSKYWTRVNYKRRDRTLNPILQNKGHIAALKELLPEKQQLPYISVVAISGRATIKQMEVTTDVVYMKNLRKTIDKYKSICMSTDVMNDIYSRISNSMLTGREHRKQHVKTIKSKVNAKDARADKKICPKCGSPLVSRKGKYGYFTGCSGYPNCRFIAK